MSGHIRDGQTQTQAHPPHRPLLPLTGGVNNFSGLSLSEIEERKPIINLPYENYYRVKQWH